MEATPRVPPPTGPTAGDTACADAAVETADIIATNRRKLRRFEFMLPSVSTSCVLDQWPRFVRIAQSLNSQGSDMPRWRSGTKFTRFPVGSKSSQDDWCERQKRRASPTFPAGVSSGDTEGLNRTGSLLPAICIFEERKRIRKDQLPPAAAGPFEARCDAEIPDRRRRAVRDDNSGFDED